MKTKWIFILAFLVTAMSAEAQDTGIKIGFTNAEFILSNMPEAKQIEADLTDYSKQLSTQLESKDADFQAYDIPGFGDGSKSLKLAANYYIYYQIPFDRK